MSSLCSSSLSTASLFFESKSPIGNLRIHSCRASSAEDVPDFLFADWLKTRRKRPFGTSLTFSAEEAIQHQLDALKYNDKPGQTMGLRLCTCYCKSTLSELIYLDFGRSNFCIRQQVRVTGVIGKASRGALDGKSYCAGHR